MFSKQTDSKPAGPTFSRYSLALSTAYALYFTVAAVGLFGLAYYFIQTLAEQKEKEVLKTRIQEYRAWYEEGGLSALKARFDEQSLAVRGVFFVRVSGPRNRVLFVHIPRGSLPFDPAHIDALSSGEIKGFKYIREKTRNADWIIAATLLRDGLVLQVGKSSTERKEFLAVFRSVFWMFILPIFLLGAAGGGVLTYRAVKPLRRLIGTMNDIMETGRRDHRTPVQGEKGEFNELVRIFNRMLDTNEGLIRAMGETLDNVAHDLRTPMTRIRTSAELALGGPENPADFKEALEDCMEESQTVLTLLNTLMDEAEARTGAGGMEKEPVCLRDLLLSVADLYELAAEDKDIRLQVEVSEPFTVWADPVRLKRAVANLVDNAVKYTPNGGTVILKAVQKKNHGEIKVSDTGCGIPPEEIDRIWDRLYRGDKSRSQKGLGLGLSFVKVIINAHGGTVAVESEPDRGSVFILEIPIKQQP